MTAPDAMIVPQGKVLDFIDGTLRRESAEEYVRQEIAKSLVREYGYSREEIAVEFRIKVGSANRLRRELDACWREAKEAGVDVTDIALLPEEGR